MNPVRRAVVSAGVAVAAVLACISFIDRPLAAFVHAHLRGVAVFPALTKIADAWNFAAIAIVAIALLCAIGGWRPGPVARSAVIAAIATLLAVVLKDQLKLAFGHTWPETWVDDNPSFIRDGVYAFVPFHGGRGWSAFPSGHTAVIAAPVAALWNRWPRLRWLGAALVVLVIAGLIGANYHFAADVVAGLIVGVVAGAGIVALLTER